MGRIEDIKDVLLSKWGLAAIGIAAAMVLMTRSKSSAEPIIVAEKYDNSLIQLGIESNLKNKELDNQLELARINADSERNLLNDAAYRQTLQTDLEGRWALNLQESAQAYQLNAQNSAQSYQLADTALNAQNTYSQTQLEQSYKSHIADMDFIVQQHALDNANWQNEREVKLKGKQSKNEMFSSVIGGTFDFASKFLNPVKVKKPVG